MLLWSCLGRSMEKFNDTELQTVTKLGEAISVQVQGLVLDLSDLCSMRKYATDFQALGFKKIDILICNAGVMAIPERQEMKQGLTGLPINSLAVSGDAAVS